ncbi:hypothetical protein BpHYR1_049437 [Brachionus plicatilis]|uniref:Uncharacterized protein n=1 Tax=Brachionus plicatilis TaxID=10195 RepID=A0A3M7R2I1_BRAPC|nr:hypothetical protein BpHYR1_049437 [Brachionus plicatilis]
MGFHAYIDNDKRTKWILQGVANGSPCISGATESVGINGTSGTGGGGGSNGTNGTQQQEDRLLHILD